MSEGTTINPHAINMTPNKPTITTLNDLQEDVKREKLAEEEQRMKDLEYEKAVKLMVQSVHHKAVDDDGKSSEDYFRLSGVSPPMNNPNTDSIDMTPNIGRLSRNEKGQLIDDNGNVIDERTLRPITQ